MLYLQNNVVYSFSFSRLLCTQRILRFYEKAEENCGSFVDFSNEKYFIGSKLGTGYYFRGKMDRYKIFGRSLSNAEISALSSE